MRQASFNEILTGLDALRRSAEREPLLTAEAHGLGAMLYSPLAGGLLTGKYRGGDTGRLSALGRGGASLDAGPTSSA